jgi:hypothetical protein
MNEAHVTAVMILGEPFKGISLKHGHIHSRSYADVTRYDFERQNITGRIHALIPTMLRYRLTPPPEVRSCLSKTAI